MVRYLALAIEVGSEIAAKLDNVCFSLRKNVKQYIYEVYISSKCVQCATEWQRATVMAGVGE